jgi:hypothetical protein
MVKAQPETTAESLLIDLESFGDAAISFSHRIKFSNRVAASKLNRVIEQGCLNQRIQSDQAGGTA